MGLAVGISDWSPDNFIIHMLLDSDMFKGHLTASFSFTFEVTMSATANGQRRRLQDDEQEFLPEVTTSLGNSSEKSSNLTFIWIAVGAVTFILMGGAAYYYIKNSAANVNKDVEIGTIKPVNSAKFIDAMSPSFSVQSAIFKEWSPEVVAAAIE